jgi:hypothetical protein
MDGFFRISRNFEAAHFLVHQFKCCLSISFVSLTLFIKVWCVNVKKYGLLLLFRFNNTLVFLADVIKKIVVWCFDCLFYDRGVTVQPGPKNSWIFSDKFEVRRNVNVNVQPNLRYRF